MKWVIPKHDEFIQFINLKWSSWCDFGIYAADTRNSTWAQQNCVTTKCAHEIQIPTINDKDITNAIVCKIVWQLLEIFLWFGLGGALLFSTPNCEQQLNILLIPKRYKAHKSNSKCSTAAETVAQNFKSQQRENEKRWKNSFCGTFLQSDARVCKRHTERETGMGWKTCSRTLVHIAYHVTRLYLQRPLWYTHCAWNFTI